MEKWSGYKVSYCECCRKETFHFLVEGEGIRAWFCRYYESHKETTHADSEQDVVLVRTSQTHLR